MKKIYITTLFLIALFISQKITAQIACHASFYIDTTATTPFNAVLINNSTFTPSPTPPDSVVYLWTWNDGTSSTSKYPTHTYTSAGIKVIKLDVDNINKTCHDSLTLWIVIDTLGGFHKTNTSYYIKVVAPATVGINSSQTERFVTLTPNIIKEYANLNFSGLNKDALVKADIYSYEGKNVFSVNEKLNGNTLQLQTVALQSGMYFVVITSGRNTSLLKFIKL